ncbi:hypothetical protein FSP39_010408 [Pinctada imbricata]|uniref:2'-phosphotransferase n=1 Tax=Pinctada imbricata TaxID=66713 RepID=A0AA89BQY4_PINIB|nr:hypothetical protein FSP39_010408 [Pinctada imbricata]
MPTSESKSVKDCGVKPEEEDSRLSKRLCYVLRYGAVKEGLEVLEGGFVDIKKLMELHIMRHNSEEEVLEEVNKSISHRGAKRFEIKSEKDKTLVRAAFCRNFETNPCHEGSGVFTLVESCLEYVSTNLDQYDLEDFPDEHLISKMIHKLKRKKKLNNTALRQLLVPVLEHLDLEGMYVTQGTIKTVYQCCPQLRVLSLKDCGYIVTDTLMEQILKRLKNLESLNLCACKHVTDRTIKALMRHTVNLKQLNLSWIHSISETALIQLITSCPNLSHLDIYDHKISPQGIETMTEIAQQTKLTIVLKGLTDKEVAPENPCLMLPNFGKVW